MSKLIVTGLILFLLIGSMGMVTLNEKEEINYMKEVKYQGPVPEGYNLEHFRITGETIPEVKE